MQANIENEEDKDQIQDKDQIAKPSQAEGERNQPGEHKEEEPQDPQPGKPSQAEGERKPYTGSFLTLWLRAVKFAGKLGCLLSRVAEGWAR